MSFLLLQDGGSHQQRCIRLDHVSSFTVNRSDHLIVLHLIGGQEVHLSHEESKQFLHHIQAAINNSGAK
ncbi:MAG TPA: hypothetical protein VFE78_36800 [Gemmataceae bacterium]|jgi:hypothetical protein|nr:hypothetical protein [Gemmataceae bacterium]